MGAIFLSYRRDDTEGQAGRLYDDLVEVFGKDAVFMDVAGIEAGRDFRKAIDQHVSSCGVLLAFIGTNWLTAHDPSGKRRLDDPNDFVRLEIASALKRDIPVIPVLVRGAQMPRAEQLPADMQDLSYRNGVELTHARWESDVELLVRALRRHVTPPGSESGARATASDAASSSERPGEGVTPAAAGAPIAATAESTPSTRPEPPPPPPPVAGSHLSRSVFALAGVAVVAVVVWMVVGGDGSRVPPSTTASTPAAATTGTAPRAVPPVAARPSARPTTDEPPVRQTAAATPREAVQAPSATDAERDVVHVCHLNPKGDNFLSLRAEASSASREIVRLGPNTILLRLDGSAGWARVRMRDDTEGWVSSRWLCDGPPPERPVGRAPKS